MVSKKKLGHVHILELLLILEEVKMMMMLGFQDY